MSDINATVATDNSAFDFAFDLETPLLGAHSGMAALQMLAGQLPETYREAFGYVLAATQNDLIDAVKVWEDWRQKSLEGEDAAAA